MFTANDAEQILVKAGFDMQEPYSELNDFIACEGFKKITVGDLNGIDDIILKHRAEGYGVVVKYTPDQKGFCAIRNYDDGRKQEYRFGHDGKALGFEYSENNKVTAYLICSNEDDDDFRLGQQTLDDTIVPPRDNSYLFEFKNEKNGEEAIFFVSEGKKEPDVISLKQKNYQVDYGPNGELWNFDLKKKDRTFPVVIKNGEAVSVRKAGSNLSEALYDAECAAHRLKDLGIRMPQSLNQNIFAYVFNGLVNLVRPKSAMTSVLVVGAFNANATRVEMPEISQGIACQAYDQTSQQDNVQDAKSVNYPMSRDRTL